MADYLFVTIPLAQFADVLSKLRPGNLLFGSGTLSKIAGLVLTVEKIVWELGYQPADFLKNLLPAMTKEFEKSRLS